MRSKQAHPKCEIADLSAKLQVKDRRLFGVPDNQCALLVRNGVPECFHSLDHCALPSGKVEVRLLSSGSPVIDFGPQALELLFERSFLYVDGELVGIRIDPESNSQTLGSATSAWACAPTGGQGPYGLG